jgi:hypothetical protein
VVPDEADDGAGKKRKRQVAEAGESSARRSGREKKDVDYSL